MHKVLKTILIVSIAGTSALAQYFPVAGEKQVVLGATGNGGFILLRKFKTEIIANRYGVGLSYNLASNTNNPLNGLENKNNNGSINASFTFGKQMNFTIGERFNPYIALDAGISISNSTNSNQSEISDTALYNKSLNNVDRQVSNDNSTKSSSLSPGIFIRPVIGFNYYLAKNFALGAECRFNIISANYAFTNNSSHNQNSYIDVDSSIDPNTGQTIYTRELITNNPPDTKTKSNAVSLSGSISPQIYITASYYFK